MSSFLDVCILNIKLSLSFDLVKYLLYSLKLYYTKDNIPLLSSLTVMGNNSFGVKVSPVQQYAYYY